MHPIQQPNGVIKWEQEKKENTSKLRKVMQLPVASGKVLSQNGATSSVGDKSAPLNWTTSGLPAVNCFFRAPWSMPRDSSYREKKSLNYPINILRNVARQAATTHYVLASDVELYPSPRLPQLFMDMLRENVSLVTDGQHKVYVLPIFEVYDNQTVPNSKEQLVSMLASKLAIPFHTFMCPKCHNIPKANQWKTLPVMPGLHIFHKAKRHEPYDHWEPFYIGTRDDPLFDERLTWEGHFNKFPQAYALCILDYDFLILDNAFLTHKPGVKVYKRVKIPEQSIVQQKKSSATFSEKNSTSCTVPIQIAHYYEKVVPNEKHGFAA